MLLSYMYIHDIVVVSFLGGGNRSIRRKRRIVSNFMLFYTAVFGVETGKQSHAMHAGSLI